MLTIHRMSPQGATENYYKTVLERSLKAKGEYYDMSGVLAGRLAAVWGLTNKEISQETFIDFLRGVGPNGEKLRADKPIEERLGEQVKDRWGLDMVFAPPKELSALLLNEKYREMIVRLHHRGVRTALAEIEKNVSALQLEVSGAERKRRRVVTGKGLFWLGTEISNRQNEPHLHTHTIWFNFTQRNGKWVATNNEFLFRNRGYFEAIYHSVMGKELAKLGFLIETMKNGYFGLKGMADVRDHFSARHKEIQAHKEALRLEYLNAGENELNNMAARYKKPGKELIPIPELYTMWLRGLPDHLRQAIFDPALKQMSPANLNVVDRAGEILTRYRAVFSKEELLTLAMIFGYGKKNFREVKHDFLRSQTVEKLAENQFTTKFMIETEKRLARIVAAGKQLGPVPLNTSDVLEYLTAEQKKAVDFALTHPSRVIAIEGQAGSGKTNGFLKPVKEAYEKAGWQVVALAPTTMARLQLRLAGFQNAQTIDEWLAKDQRPEGKILAVLDESSFVDTAKALQVLQRLPETARIIFVGDQKQLLSIGPAMEGLVNLGILPDVQLDGNVRQTGELKRAVEAFRDRPVYGATLLDGMKSLAFEPSREKRLARAAEEFTKGYRNGDMLVTVTNADRDDLNERVRKQFQETGKISKKDGVYEIWQPKNLTELQPHLAAAYDIGDAVLFAKEVAGIPKGTVAKVTRRELDTQEVTVALGDKLVTVDVSKNGHDLSAFKVSEKAFSPREQIVFTKANKFYGVANGERATVLAVEDGKMVVEMERKQPERVILDMDIMKCIDRAWATTAYKGQGATAGKVIYTGHGRETDFRVFYVAISRAKESVVAVVDRVKDFYQNIPRVIEKPMALEVKPELLKENEHGLSFEISP